MNKQIKCSSITQHYCSLGHRNTKVIAKMRAKRSKKYRKIMQTYQLHYNFREPYQVLMTSSFLRAIHAYHMPTPTFLETVLHGKVVPYVTQCTLAAVMEGYSGKGRDGRPVYLPAPTLAPLRYCKHKNEKGEEIGPIPETECLYDLISGQARGNEVRKNKNHYIVGAADWDEGVKDDGERKKLEDKRRKRRKVGENIDVDIRDFARTIPGVPVVYVKRSVMILEEPSIATERAIRGDEKEKFKDGIGGAARGTKRGRAEDSDDDENGENDIATQPRIRGTAKARGPNPLSVRKKKVKLDRNTTTAETAEDAKKTLKKRKRGKRGRGGALTTDTPVNNDDSA